MRSPNWVDILVVILVSSGAYIGYKKGLVAEVFKSIGAAAAIVVSLHYYRRLGRFISTHSFVSPYYAYIFSIVVLLLATLFLFRVIRTMTEGLVNLDFEPHIDGFGGFFLGLVRGGMLASIILVCLIWLPMKSVGVAVKWKSYLGPSLVKVTPTIYDGVMKLNPGRKTPKARQIFEHMAKARHGEQKKQARENEGKDK